MSSIRGYRWCLGCLLWCCVLLQGGALAFAAQPLDSVVGRDSIRGTVDTLIDIESVAVQAARRRHVIPPQLLHGKELSNLSAVSVADAIRFFSGVQLKDYGGVGGLKTINVRSMGSQHVGVYYDGIQIGNAQNGQVDLGKYSLDNVESIALYNGQKSEIFQPAKDFASAGSVYIETRRPTFAEGHNTNVRITAKGGSFDMGCVSGLVEHRITSSISCALNAEWLHASGEYKFRYRRFNQDGSVAYDTTAVRKNGDINAIRAEMGLYGTLPGGNWRIRLYHYNSERGMPGAIVNNVWRRGERLWDRNSFIQGTLRTTVVPWYRLQVAFKYAFDFVHYTNLDPTQLMVNNSYRQQEAYLSLANLFTITDWLSASCAYDFQYNTLLTRDEAKLDVVYGFPFPHRYQQQAAVAVAFDKWGVKLQGSVLYSYVINKTERFYEPPDRKAWSPGVFFSYNPYQPLGITLRAFYKHSFRMPTFNDLYYTEIGNINLEPEYTVQYDGGLEWYKSWSHAYVSHASISIDGYYNEVWNKIIAYPKGSQFRWTMLNLGYVQIRGVDVLGEIVFSLPQHIRLTSKLQYTWQRAEDYTDDFDKYYGDQIPYIPWHSGSAIAGLEWKGELGLNYSFIYVGERYNQQENIIYNYTQPWYTHDLTLWWEHRWKPCTLRVAADVCNLLSQDYDVVLNYPMPKRNYKLTIRVTI